MRLQYDEIEIKKRLIISKGELDIPQKGVCQIKGKNGTGKTLLLQNLFYCYKDNYVINLVNQNNHAILKDCSVMDNITMNNNPEKRQEVERLMEKLGLQFVLKADAKTLSGGEKRLISILRAIVSEADIIMLDEPTNDLDFRIVDKLIQLIQIYKTEKSFIIVSHDNRLDEISDIIYRIVDKKLEKIVGGVRNDKGLILRQNYNLDKRFISSRFKKNYFVYIIILLFLFGILYCIGYMKELQQEEYSNTYKGQIDIYIPLSDFASIYNMQGAVPISNLSYFKSDMKMKDYFTFMKNLKENEGRLINYGLDLSSTKKYTVYNMEYYDTDEKRHYYTLDTYVQDIYKEKTYSVCIDTTSIFEYGNLEEYDKCVKFKESDFRICESQLQKSKKELKVLHIIVMLEEDYSFWDFIKTKEVKELLQGNFYIRSNETIAICNQINSLYLVKRIGEILFSIIIVCFVLDFFFCIVNLLIIKKNILIFRDYGINKKDLCKIIINKYNSKIFSVFCIGILLIGMLIMLNGCKETLSMNNISLVILFVIVEVMIKKCNQSVFEKGISKVYDWRYRC